MNNRKPLPGTALGAKRSTGVANLLVAALLCTGSLMAMPNANAQSQTGAAHASAAADHAAAATDAAGQVGGSPGVSTSGAAAPTGDAGTAGGVAGTTSPQGNSTAGVSSGTTSDSSIAASAPDDASIRSNARSTTHSNANSNVAVSVSNSQALGVINESGGVLIGHAHDHSFSIAIDTPGQSKVMTKSKSTAKVHTGGTIADASMAAASDGSAQANIVGGPSADATTSAEAAISP